jgi:hypothetical protein
MDVLDIIKIGKNGMDFIDDGVEHYDKLEERKNRKDKNKLDKIFEEGLEQKIYNLLKLNKNVKINEIKPKNNVKIIGIDEILLVPIAPSIAGIKIVKNMMTNIKNDKNDIDIMERKYKIFKGLFNECGLKDKMINDVYYRPDENEMKLFVEEYKLRADIELIDVLHYKYKNK